MAGRRNYEWIPATAWDGVFTQDKVGGSTESVSKELVELTLEADGFTTKVNENFIVAKNAVAGAFPENPSVGDVYLYGPSSLYNLTKVIRWDGEMWQEATPKNGALAALEDDFGSLPGEWLWQYRDGFWDNRVSFNSIRPYTIYGGDGNQLVSSGRNVYATSLSASDLAGSGLRLASLGASGQIQVSPMEGIVSVHSWTSAIPSSPADGARYFILSGAQPPWDAIPGQIATWRAAYNAWEYFTPVAGTLLRDRTGRLAQVGNPGVVAGLLTNGPLSSSDLGGSGDRILAANAVGNVIQKTASEARALIGAVDAATVGAANGVASLDATGRVPAAQLPSYVDDVLEYADFASFPGTGESGKIYISLATNRTYRWGGSSYVEVSPGALGGSGTTGLPAVWGSGSTLTSQSAGTFRTTIGALSSSSPSFTGSMVGDFGRLRQAAVGGPYGLYPPAMPTATNHVVLWDATGALGYFNAGTSLFCTIAGVEKVELTASLFNIYSGVDFKVSKLAGSGERSAVLDSTGKLKAASAETRTANFNIQDTVGFVRIPAATTCTMTLPAPTGYGGFKRKLTFGQDASFTVSIGAGTFLFKRRWENAWSQHSSRTEGMGAVVSTSIYNLSMNVWCDGTEWYVVIE